MHKDKERYPDSTDADYECVRWAEADKDDEIFPSGETWYYFNNPDECGTSVDLTNRLPKRKREADQSRVQLYGIYIEQRHSVLQIIIPGFVMLAATLGATMWFFPVWLRQHQDDLQNASIPVTIALQVVGLILNFAISLVVFRWSI